MNMVKRRLVVAACLLVVLPGIAQAATDSSPADVAPAGSAAAPSKSPGPSQPGSPLSSATPPKVKAAAPQGAGAATVPLAKVPDSGNPAKLEEVVVTATKRAQSVRDVPSTINVLSGARLEEKGARELKDFIDLVPGIKLAEATADSPSKLAIRGVGPDNTTNQTVGTVLGDIALSDPFGNYTLIDPDPWDMKTVEILKGPQGTLFGASSLAGMIRYVPNTPVLGQWEGKSFAEWVAVKDGGSDPTYGAALNVPVGSTLAFRASGVVQHDPGVIDINTANRHVADADQTHKWAGRAAALWQPLTRLTVNAWYMDQQSHSDEPNFVTNMNGQFSRNDAPTPSPSHHAFSLGALDTRYAFDWATLVSLTSFQHKVNRFDLDETFNTPGEAVAQTGLSVLRALEDVKANGFVQEVRLVSPDGKPWTWLTGAYYSTYTADIFANIYAANTAFANSYLALLPKTLLSAADSPQGVSLANQLASPVKSGEHALFGELTRSLGPWSVTLGGRFYRTDINANNVVTSGILPALTTGSAGSTSKAAVTSDGFSPKLAITLHPTRDLMFYTSASRGFQYGGINVVAIPLAPYPPTFKSSTLWNYEVGARTDWFNRTLRFDLTAFYLDWKNPQVGQVTPNNLEAYVSNVGAARSRGFESTFRYLPPIKGLSFEVAAAYIEARTTVPFADSSGAAVPVGTSMPNSPTLQTASTLAYKRLFGPWRTQTSLEYLHVNSAWNDIAHDHTLDARNTYNVNFTVVRSDLAFAPALSVVVDNLTNEKKLLSVHEGTPSTFTTSGYPVVYSRPRTIELRLSTDF